MSTNPAANPDSPIGVTFSLASPGARVVSVAVFFDPSSAELPFPESGNRGEVQPKNQQMVRYLMRLALAKPGLWRCEMPLSPGRYEYLFLVDGAWVMDPEAPEVSPDYAGGFNAARTVVAPTAVATVAHLPAAKSAGGRQSALRRAS